MFRTLTFGGFLVMLCAAHAGATVIHVPAAYTTIQEGINASSNGDTVLVSAGIYSEHITFLGKNIVVKSQDGPETTIIQAASANRPIVRFQSGEPYTATLEGFTVREAHDSSAVFISSSGATLRGNIFSNNIGALDGGAVNAINGDTIIVLNNVFRLNSSTETGGALHVLGLAMIIRGNEFRNNTTVMGGAAWLGTSTYALVDHNLIVGNISSSRQASAMFFSLCTGGGFYNNTVTRDTSRLADSWAPVLEFAECDNYHIYNNIIADNVGTGIFNYSSAGLLATYNDVWGNLTNYYNITPGTGSISADPIFEGGDPYSYHPAASSSCINAGDPASPSDPNGSRADMGAFYSTYVVETGYVAGIVLDTLLNPIEGVNVSGVNTGCMTTTDGTGHFVLSGLRSDFTYGSYDIHFHHGNYYDTTLAGITVTTNDTTFLEPVKLTYMPVGYIAGIVLDTLLNPLCAARVEALGTPFWDSTNGMGYFILEKLPSGLSYNIRFKHNDYSDTVVTAVLVSENDTTILNMGMRSDYYDSLTYIAGDINCDNDATPLADLVFGGNYFRGGAVIPHYYYCTDHTFCASADASGNCQFNGIDLAYLSYYWTGGPTPVSCSTCPAPRPDPPSLPSSPDPGIPDSIIVGNLNLSPIWTQPGDTVTIPIWLKNDEATPAFNIPLAADMTCLTWFDGTLQSPINNWFYCSFRNTETDRPITGYATKTLLGWRIYSGDSSCINTNGAYRQIASFKAIISLEPGCDPIQIIAGTRSRVGGAAFCDSAGLSEWVPAIAGGLIALGTGLPEIEVSPTTYCDTLYIGYETTWDLRISNAGTSDLVYGLYYDPTMFSVEPDTGLVSPGAAVTVSICPSPGLPEGEFPVQFHVNSNDPDEGTIPISGILVVTHDVPPGCAYIPGDLNGIGGPNGIDVVYGVNFLKGGTPPVDDCNPPCLTYPNPNPPYQQLPLADPFYAAIDVNGNCMANGIDITYFVAFLKGLQPALQWCPDCPPAARGVAMPETARPLNMKQ